MATPVGADLAGAIRATYERAGVSQDQLAAATGFDQTSISAWVRGVRRTPLEALPAIERVCGVRLGTILRMAGYVEDDPGDVRAAIMADPTLDDFLKDVLLANYDGIQRALAMRSNVSPTPANAVPSS